MRQPDWSQLGNPCNDGPYHKYEIPNLLVSSARAGRTSRLSLQRGTTKRILSYVEGRLISVTSNALSERLSTWLIARGVITQTVLDAADKLIAEKKIQVGRALVDLGAVTAAELAEHLIDYRSFIVSKIAGEEMVEALFEPLGPPPTTPRGAPILVAVENGVRSYTADERATLLEELGPYELDIGDSTADTARQIGCSDSLAQLLKAVKRGRIALNNTLVASEDDEPGVPALTLFLSGLVPAYPTGQKTRGAGARAKATGVDVDAFLADLGLGNQAPSDGPATKPQATKKTSAPKSKVKAKENERKKSTRPTPATTIPETLDSDTAEHELPLVKQHDAPTPELPGVPKPAPAAKTPPRSLGADDLFANLGMATGAQSSQPVELAHIEPTPSSTRQEVMPSLRQETLALAPPTPSPTPVGKKFLEAVQARGITPQQLAIAGAVVVLLLAVGIFFALRPGAPKVPIASSAVPAGQAARDATALPTPASAPTSPPPQETKVQTTAVSGETKAAEAAVTPGLGPHSKGKRSDAQRPHPGGSKGAEPEEAPVKLQPKAESPSAPAPAPKPAEAPAAPQPAAKTAASPPPSGEQDVTFRLGIARQLLQQKQYRQAVDICREVLAQDPRNALAYRNLGIAYTGMNAKSEACESYRRYLRFAPNAADRDKVQAIIELCE